MLALVSPARLVGSALLAILVGIALLTTSVGAPAVHAQGSVDRISVALRWWDAEQSSAEQSGDLDTALAQFADNAVFIGTSYSGNCSTQTPCTDLAGIRQLLQVNIANHGCYTFRSLQVSGSIVTGVREVRTDNLRAIGVERAVQAFIVLVPDDKITFFAAVLDLADPQTAQRGAIIAGTQPAGAPLPAPTTPCPALL